MRRSPANRGREQVEGREVACRISLWRWCLPDLATTPYDCMTCFYALRPFFVVPVDDLMVTAFAAESESLIPKALCWRSVSVVGCTETDPGTSPRSADGASTESF